MTLTLAVLVILSAVVSVAFAVIVAIWRLVLVAERSASLWTRMLFEASKAAPNAPTVPRPPAQRWAGDRNVS